MTAVMLTGVGKRYDIVSAFAQHAFTIAADPSPLAPAQYAADLRVAPPRIDDPDYVPFLLDLCTKHNVGAVVPLTDLDIEVLARARPELPAFVPDAEIARDTFDKYEAHLLLERHGLPSPPTVLPGEEPASYPVMVKPRRGSGAESIHPAHDREQADFFCRYLEPTPVMVQKLMDGPEVSIDCLSDRDARCLNAIPRSMLESRGGESIKGASIKDRELIEHACRVAETVGIVGPANVQCFREPDGSLPVTDVNPRFGGAFPLPLASGSRYPELALALAEGERPEPRLGDFRAGVLMTRFFSHLCLTAEDGGSLVPFAEELPEPVAGEPGEA